METRYATSGAVHVAFQTHGSGRDLVYVPGWVSHLELEWDNVLARRFYEDLASFTRLIRFDKRGTGMSDREEPTVRLERRIDDIVAVMDAAGSERASLFGFSEGGAMAAAFAARHPERVERLVLFASHGGRVTGGDDFPCGYEAESAIAWMREVVASRWGQGASMEHLAPSMWRHRQAEQAKAWMARFERMAATPGAALAHFDFNLTNDVRAVLPSNAAPTLVLHRRDDRFVPLCNGEHLAAAIPDARLVVVDGEDHVPWVGDAARIVDEVELFLTGRQRARTTTSAVAADPLGSLTPAEHRVAEAVAEGLTNPQIAEALHLSRHTVESHLKRIYAKLGVTRVELATLVSRGPGG
jgi:pimeloyl-ACP methyl ester carboxylesterase/DNA-binding CsgD family transcriptional regulator